MRTLIENGVEKLSQKQISIIDLNHSRLNAITKLQL
jgi:hypothetical protein